MAAPAAALSLRQVFDLAWSRQPELLSQAARRDAAEAGRRAASSWSAEPASVDLLGTTDQLLGSSLGRRDLEAALTVPLWLPGERQRSGRLAEAESAALDARLQAARLKLAAAVRSAWWATQRAAVQVDLARERLRHSSQLAADVARRFAAGDVSRADQVSVDAAVAQAESALAEAQAEQLSARATLHGLAGNVLPPAAAPNGEAGPTVERTPEVMAQRQAESSPERQPVRSAAVMSNRSTNRMAEWIAEPVPERRPESPADLSGLTRSHPAIAELLARTEVARQAAELASVQTRSNPELRLATTRERGQVGEAYRQSVSVGLRFALGASPRADARAAVARAEMLEADSLVALERARLAGDIDLARARLDASRQQMDAAQRRARLVGELRGFVDKAFRLGESDLPTRLRVETDAAEAERLAARARLDVAVAISTLRQALGLLPE
jgi:cobalt-zinc-cadmium efflux system outer membrane protein